MLREQCQLQRERIEELKRKKTRKELLAVVYELKQFRQYLLGRHIVIRTDHAAFSWLRCTPKPMPQLARWLTFIEQYDYEVAHRPGKRHGNADGLSRKPDRRPLPDVEEENDEYDQELDELPPREWLECWTQVNFTRARGPGFDSWTDPSKNCQASGQSRGHVASG